MRYITTLFFCHQLSSNLVPIRASNDHSKANIQDDARNTESKPEALDAHSGIEGQYKGEGHADHVVAQQSVEGPEHLSA